jgi:hypothetical protein
MLHRRRSRRRAHPTLKKDRFVKIDGKGVDGIWWNAPDRSPR